MLDEIAENYSQIITIEEGAIIGGFGASVAMHYNQNQIPVKIKHLGIPDLFIEHATVKQQLEICNLDENYLKNLLESYLNL